MTDESSSDSGGTLDPPGGHSKEALEDAVEKMNIDEGDGRAGARSPWRS